MGFLGALGSGVGQGANSIAGNLPALLHLQMMNQYRKAQEAKMAAEEDRLRSAEAKEAGMLTDMRNLPFSKNMALLQSAGVIDPSTQTSDPRALAQIAGGNVPAGMMSGWNKPTIQDRLAVLYQYDPKAALAEEVKLIGVNQKGGLTLPGLVNSGKYDPASIQDFVDDLNKTGKPNLKILKKIDTDNKNQTVEQLTATALNDPDPMKRKQAQAILDAMEKRQARIAKEGRAVFSTTATGTPGIAYERESGRYFETDENGKKRYLTSSEVKGRNLQFREETPTNDIKVMQQSVPSVIQLVNQSIDALDKTSTGPLAGRWKDAWSTKIGAEDADFRRLKTSVNLLQTRLMKMHVGARGGEYIMKHFQEILTAGKDSPGNLKAALREIEAYANEVKQSIVNPPATDRPKERTVVRRGTYKGKKVVQYSDGSTEYAE